MSEVAEGKVVYIQYVVYGEDGAVIDRTDHRPFAYLAGAGNIVPGLEAALLGKSVGERVDVTLSPPDAYGALNGDVPQPVHRSELPKGARQVVGSAFTVASSSGKPVRLWITQVKGSRVWVTTDHPLAGQTLRFDVVVDRVREPSAEERAHGHAHAEGVNHH